MTDTSHGEPQRLALLTAAHTGSGGSIVSSDLRQQVERYFIENREHVYFYLLTCGAQPADADDLTQDAFVRLHRHLRDGHRVEKLRPWLFRVARNLLIDRRRAARHESPVAGSDWLHWQETVADPSVDLERAALQEQRQADLGRVFQLLTPLQVQYLHLRADGLRYREIAEIYGVAVSTVVDAVRRAVERLGKEMV